jgi:hypothetical protein
MNNKKHMGQTLSGAAGFFFALLALVFLFAACESPVDNNTVDNGEGDSTEDLPSLSHTVTFDKNGGLTEKGAPAVKAELKNFSIHADVRSMATENSGTAVGLAAAYGEHALFEGIDVSGSFSFENRLTAYAGGVVGILRGSGTIVRNCVSSLTMDIRSGSGNPLITGLPNPFLSRAASPLIMEDGVGIENCRNSGDITAISAAGGSQFMTGGILGGTFYGLATGITVTLQTARQQGI